MNGPKCPHCEAPLSTYSVTIDNEPRSVSVLVCASCDKVLGVIGSTSTPSPGL